MANAAVEINYRCIWSITATAVYHQRRTWMAPHANLRPRVAKHRRLESVTVALSQLSRND